MTGRMALVLAAAALAGLTLIGWLGWPHARAPQALTAPADALGLPPLPQVSATAAQIELGRQLFFERRLSFNQSMSCGMCHVPEEGFASNASKLALGIEGRSLKRNAPTLLNVAWQRLLFHDGREPSLVAQAWSPLLHADEMANPSAGHVLQLLQKDLPYARGFELFIGRAKCSQCHSVGPRDALFSDGAFHVTGAGAVRPRDIDFTLAPGVTTRVEHSVLDEYESVQAPDLGRFEITLDPDHRHAFKTPSLRNVARTAPYMHDGSLATLGAVLDFYDLGGGDIAQRSPLLTALGLSPQDKQDMAAFLRSLDSAALSRLTSAARRD